ncbi:MAG: archease [Conexivisphaerales archaeon]
MKVKELEYMGDALLEVKGSTINECFEGAAYAFLSLTYDVKKVNLKVNRSIELDGMDLENLLYKWLEKLLILLTAENLAVGKASVSINGLRLEADVWGERYSRKKHGFKMEVKGITYHLMSIETPSEKCKMRFLADL